MKLISLFTILILLIGCSKSDDEVDESDFEKGLLENQSITISGTNRDYHLYVPNNPTNAPIVFLFHANRSNYNLLLGIGLTANREIKAPYKTWINIAQQENIVLVVPNGIDRGWNDCRNDATGNPNSDDVLFTEKLMDFVINKYQANSSKVFVVGTSNGGHMAMRLAQEIPNKLKAFAAIVAANPKDSQCTNSRMPVSALFMNGTEDDILPYEGGSMEGRRGNVFSAQETIDYWVNRNETDTTPIKTEFANTNTTDNCTVTKYVYGNGTNNTEVTFYKVDNGGHAEPSIAERYSDDFLSTLGNQNSDIEMAIEVWNFFKTK
ncbi:alpha/beta hydrolase family esterase [Aureibaculum conchae]|uniref:alpha/beta hydrolase family esterase n=1 Tax=Aureibaculum sp. 2308TA14-22 TaxID=3108392 RepID=UPI00339280F2